MSRFDITEDTTLSQKKLESINVKSWAEAYTWTALTELGIKDPLDKATFLKMFPTAQQYKFVDKLIVQQFCIWKGAQKQQVPTYMALDVATTQGKKVDFTDPDCAVIESTPPVLVPLSRVPLAEPDLFLSGNGPATRNGSDILAASIGAMTRWTGSQVVWSMPLDTMAKREFVHARVEGIRPLLGEIPTGQPDVGSKGRLWTYTLMAHFQKMEMNQYAALCSNWVRAMFGLPAPRADLVLPKWTEDNFSIIRLNSKFYYKLLYRNPAELARFQNAYKDETQYEAMATQLVEFAAERQGDSSGVSMLSQSSASWGLVSKAQAELEQAVSLIVGVAAECTLVHGFSRPELDRIRESVKVLDSQIHVYEKVESHLRTDSTKQMVDMEKAGLYLIKMRTMIDTSLVATRMGRVKSYAKEEALTKMWAHVQGACTSPKVVVLTAALPPLDTVLSIFPAGTGWNSVFFFSLRKEITKAQKDPAQGLNRVLYKTMTAKNCWLRIIKGMNNSITHWVVPPVNKSPIFTALLSPIGISKKTTLSYVPDSDDYDVQYEDEVGEYDVENTGEASSVEDDSQSGAEESEANDQGQGEAEKKEKEKELPLQKKKKPPPAGVIAVVEDVAEC